MKMAVMKTTLRQNSVNNIQTECCRKALLKFVLLHKYKKDEEKGPFYLLKERQVFLQKKNKKPGNLATDAAKKQHRKKLHCGRWHKF